MSDDLRRIVRRRREGDGPLRVFVELARAAPDETTLAHLADLGLAVERVIGNKVLGAIARERVAALEADPAVRLVERSRTLKEHED